MNLKELYLHHLLSYLHTPYLWAGSTSLKGLDCSGFVQDSDRFLGIDPPGDQTADDLYKHYMMYGKNSKVADLGFRLFFGKPHRVIHIALGINDTIMIEAGGGDQVTTSLDQAIKQNARIRLSRIDSRKDLVDCVRPAGLPW